MSRDERIQKLSRAPDWAAALIILTSKYFAGDGRVWQHVDLHHESINFNLILADGTFSSGEYALLQLAASLFSTDVEVNLWETLGKMDDNARGIALWAIAKYCGIDFKLVDQDGLDVLQRKAGLKR